ncbi:MAG: 4a-hydroxytetrahydrobiopterin dehydratase [Actinomycetota bacterium]|nr:4a-hydroxytetrahydrobiopterin dehydratase [Actinomycetota bacterium]
MAADRPGGSAGGLPAEEIERRLRDLPGWRYEGGEIHKWFKFAGFPEAIDFLGRIVEPAERLNHHPDVENHYNRVRIALHTWTENAVTDKDLALAREIEALAAR